jgi:anti-sigma factor RsiW
MSDPAAHDIVREMLALDALDALSPAERAELDRHLTTCAECRGELAALRDAAASIGKSLPPRPLPPEREAGMRARLLGRAI